MDDSTPEVYDNRPCVHCGSDTQWSDNMTDVYGEVTCYNCLFTLHKYVTRQRDEAQQQFKTANLRIDELEFENDKFRTENTGLECQRDGAIEHCGILIEAMRNLIKNEPNGYNGVYSYHINYKPLKEKLLKCDKFLSEIKEASDEQT